MSSVHSDGAIVCPDGDNAAPLTFETFADGGIGLRFGDHYLAADLDGVVPTIALGAKPSSNSASSAIQSLASRSFSATPG